jgi:hypothetical protein
VEVSQLLHELGPEPRAAVLKDLRADGERLRRGRVTQAPTAHVGKQRDQFDGGFGEAVDGLLLVAGIIAARH